MTHRRSNHAGYWRIVEKLRRAEYRGAYALRKTLQTILERADLTNDQRQSVKRAIDWQRREEKRLAQGRLQAEARARELHTKGVR